MVRAVNPTAAAAVLVLVAIAAVTLLYLWAAHSVSPKAPEAKQRALCALKLDAATATNSSIVAWVRSLYCTTNITVAYLEGIDNSRSYKLNAMPPVELKPGAVREVRFIPEEQVEPGTYRIRIPTPADDAVAIIRITGTIAGGPTASGNITSLNSTIIERRAYTIKLNVTEVPDSPGNYRLYFYICANPGYTIYYEYAEILNSTWQHPVYIGQYSVVEDNVNYTYPDCYIQYWQPLVEWEQPYHIVLAVKWRRS